MWSVPDWRSDDVYLTLDNRERGIYRELIDECWVGGSISSDPEILAKFVREPLDYFAQVWAKIRRKFRSVQRGERLVSKRLEEDRLRLNNSRQKNRESGRLGGLAAQKLQKQRRKHAVKTQQRRSNNAAASLIKASNLESGALNSLQAKSSQIQNQIQNIDSSSLQDSSSLENKSSLENGPSNKTSTGRSRDLASDYFACKCRERTGTPYVLETPDFVMLAKLRRAFQIPARQLPPGWEQATENYFASPLGQYSLADLANPKRYAVFKNSPIDQFNKPVRSRHDKETYGERVARKNRETAALIDQQLFGAARDGVGSDDPARTDSALLPRPK